MAITPQWKDELRARITLSTLVQRSVKLTRAGREWKGCCPFHEEKTPSFYVNDQKQFYHCFGCGAHGDAISWMVDNQGLQFMDAVKELAAMAGMEVPAPDPVMAKRLRPILFEHVRLHGKGTWRRQKNRSWLLEKLYIDSFELLRDESLREAVNRVRQLNQKHTA